MKKTISVLLTIIMLCALASCSLFDSEEVKRVKNGNIPNYATNLTVGEAFSNFLGSPKWESFEENGKKIVQCTGKCTYKDELANAKIKFILNDDNTFKVDSMYLNDIEQIPLFTAAFLEKLYESAAQKLGKTITKSGGSLEDELLKSFTNNSTPTPPAKQEKDVEPGDVDPKTQHLSVFEFVEDYLQEYRLDIQVLTDAEIARLNQTDTRQLINALYAYHGYTFESETYRRFFGRMNWYAPKGKAMDACEAEFNNTEKTNKELLVNYEKANNWR